MMERMDALRELLAKVEAGDDLFLATDIADAFGPFGPLNEGESWMAYKAYQGSLNAAKALHEAVLPDWTIKEISQSSTHKTWLVHIQKPAGTTGRDPFASAEIPARAWLISILKALISMEQAKTEGAT